jgi:hypothetical protein
MPPLPRPVAPPPVAPFDPGRSTVVTGADTSRVIGKGASDPRSIAKRPLVRAKPLDAPPTLDRTPFNPTSDTHAPTQKPLPKARPLDQFPVPEFIAGNDVRPMAVPEPSNRPSQHPVTPTVRATLPKWIWLAAAGVGVLALALLILALR